MSTEVPREIILRGRSALEAYNKALAEGRTFDKRVPIMIIGEECSGKTSLMKSLRGELFKPDEKSTVGIDVGPSHFKVTTEIWKVGEESQTNLETRISFEHHAARETVKILMENEKEEKERAPDPKERIPIAKHSDNIPLDDTVSESASNDVTPFLSAVPSASSHTSEITSVSSSSTSSHPEEDSIPLNVGIEMEKIRENDNQVEDEDVYSVLWDFAGQSVYYTTHPLFLTSRAIYLLVNDLSQDPDKKKYVLKQDMYKTYEDKYDLKTSKDYLHFWVSSVASLASQQQVSSESEVQESVQEEEENDQEEQGSYQVSSESKVEESVREEQESNQQEQESYQVSSESKVEESVREEQESDQQEQESYQVSSESEVEESVREEQESNQQEQESYQVSSESKVEESVREEQESDQAKEESDKNEQENDQKEEESDQEEQESNHEEQESDQVSSESEVLPEKLPAVFLVFTHADTPYDKCKPSKLPGKMYESLRSKPYKTHLYHRFFVVDNTKSGSGSECPEVVCLRKEVLAVCKALPQMKEAIPIKWLKFEKELQDVRKSDEKWITLERAKTVAAEKCNIIDDREFQTSLDFMHDKRILIHFNDTPELNKLVILDPQFLIDVLKKVITVKNLYNDRKEQKFESHWKKLREKGILDKKLLKHVWAPLLGSKEASQSLITIMKKFSLLCDWSPDDQYLVPSMLPSYPPEKIKVLFESLKNSPLFLKFESGQVPLGFFPRLLLKLLKVFQCGEDKAFLSKNYARFCFLLDGVNYSLFLQCCSSFVKVFVDRGNASHNVNHDSLDLKCAREVREKLGSILVSMGEDFFWLRNMGCKVSFICPVCCQRDAVNFCSRHEAESCKEEECLHFWDESNLVNAKNGDICTKSGDALNNTVQLKQFFPWFADQVNNLNFFRLSREVW